jgi:hypothetical protein
MGDVVAELLVTEAAIEKLGVRGISIEETRQLPRNVNITVRNPHDPRPLKRRLLLIGRTDGGRALTLVIEQTTDPTTWLIITGWEAAARERRILDAES